MVYISDPQVLWKVSVPLLSFPLSLTPAMIERITEIDFEEKTSPKSAVIYFEKAAAAKTALMVKLLPGITQSGSPAYAFFYVAQWRDTA